MSSIRRSSLISITLGLLTVMGASFRSLRLRRRQDTSRTWVWRGQARIIVEVEARACPLRQLLRGASASTA